MVSFDESVYAIVRKIPKGKVSTYKAVAEALGTRAYRAVGNALRRNPYADVPCHRVVRSDLSIGGYKGKRRGRIKESMLRQEKVMITNACVEKGFVLRDLGLVSQESTP